MKENIYVLAESNSNYKNFFEAMEKQFKKIEIFTVKERLKKELNHRLSNFVGDNNNLIIVFAEYPFLAEISAYLNENFNLLNYILVAFYHENIIIPSSCSNVFEFINTGFEYFDKEFFFNKLNAEIFNKNRISLLQFEVREFYEIGKSLSSEKDTIKLFEMIINSSISLTSSDAGTIYLVVDSQNRSWSSIKNSCFDDKLLKFIIARNMSMDINLEASTSSIIKESISGYTVITGRSLRIEDAYSISPELDYRHDRSYDINTGYVTKSILSIPMKDHENNVMGVIQLINKKKSKYQKINYSDKASMENIIPYDYTDELIMNSLAGQAAVALENNLLYRDMQKLLQDYREQNNHLSLLSRKILKAHEEERKRIAREIHDGPAQSSSSLALKLEVCKKYMQLGDYEKLSRELDRLGDGLRGTVKEIRTIIYDLKPSYLEDGLIQAVENYIKVFNENTGIKVGFNVSGSDEKVEYYMISTVYRIVQEALSNVFKHAEATKVEVDLYITERDILIKILDDGKGFDASSLRTRKKNILQGGFGLEGMRERVELMRGSLSIESTPGKGTDIKIVMPLV